MQPTTPAPAPQPLRGVNRTPAAYAAPATDGVVRQVPPGARRMPAVARLQRTEFLDVPVWHAPTGRAHSDWPVVDFYARLAWRVDEFMPDHDALDPRRDSAGAA